MTRHSLPPRPATRADLTVLAAAVLLVAAAVAALAVWVASNPLGGA